MTPGQVVRKILGPAFTPVARAYRSIFVDMDRIAAEVAAGLPHGAHVLELGGGDGALSELLLVRRPDVRITMSDLAPQIGGFLPPQRRERVNMRPATDTAALIADGFSCDAVIIAYVLHHVPRDARPGFWRDVAALRATSGFSRLSVVDLETNSIRSSLSLFSDHWITGDRHVTLVPSAQMEPAIRQAFADDPPTITVKTVDHPSYVMVATWP